MVKLNELKAYFDVFDDTLRDRHENFVESTLHRVCATLELLREFLPLFKSDADLVIKATVRVTS